MPRQGGFISRGARIRSISRLPGQRSCPSGGDCRAGFVCRSGIIYIDKIHKKFPVKFT